MKARAWPQCLGQSLHGQGPPAPPWETDDYRALRTGLRSATDGPKSLCSYTILARKEYLISYEFNAIEHTRLLNIETAVRQIGQIIT